MSTVFTQVFILVAIAFTLGLIFGVLWPGWRERRRDHDEAR